VTLKIVYSGTAADGSTSLACTVKIPAGASSAQFNVATIDDKITEGTENFVVKIDSATGGTSEPASAAPTAASAPRSSTTMRHRSSTWMPTNSSGATGADYKVTFTENTPGTGVPVPILT
jgi:surface adhesion protein